jgi:hypothetical protein
MAKRRRPSKQTDDDLFDAAAERGRRNKGAAIEPATNLFVSPPSPMLGPGVQDPLPPTTPVSVDFGLAEEMSASAAAGHLAANATVEPARITLSAEDRADFNRLLDVIEPGFQVLGSIVEELK